MPDDKKDFFNIAQMSQAWRSAGESIRKSENTQEMLMYWQTSALIACAQQLAVIAGKIDKACESLSIVADEFTLNKQS